MIFKMPVFKITHIVVEAGSTDEALTKDVLWLVFLSHCFFPLRAPFI